MRILNSVYKLILDSVPEYMPETGGMLGGQDDTITTVVFDNGKIDDFRRCHYTPDVARLNRCLLDWGKDDIEFFGLFHTHFYGVASLSKGDITYIKEILKAMPQSKNVQYFPIVVLPDKKIISYRYFMDEETLNVVKDPFICVEALES